MYTHIAEMKNHGIGESKLLKLVALCAQNTLNWKLDGSRNKSSEGTLNVGSRRVVNFSGQT